MAGRTDQPAPRRHDAIRKAYDVLNALTVLQPSTALNDLLVLLFAIEDRAKLYYISGGKTSGGDTPTPSGGTTQGGTSGGGTSTEGGTTPPGGDDDNGDID